VSHEISRPLWAHALLRQEPAEIMKTPFLQSRGSGVWDLAGRCGQPALVRGHVWERGSEAAVHVGCAGSHEVSVCVNPIKCDAWRCSQHWAFGGNHGPYSMLSSESASVQASGRV